MNKMTKYNNKIVSDTRQRDYGDRIQYQWQDKVQVNINMNGSAYTYNLVCSKEATETTDFISNTFSAKEHN